jgi:hypothetical protein
MKKISMRALTASLAVLVSLIGVPLVAEATQTMTLTPGEVPTAKISTLPTGSTVVFAPGNYTVTNASLWLPAGTTVQAAGATISVKTAGRNLIVPKGDNVTIQGGTWNGDGQAVVRATEVKNLKVSGSTLVGGTQGIVLATGSTATVENVTASGGTNNGLHVTGASTATVSASSFTAYSGHGVGAYAGSTVTLTSVQASSNGVLGLVLENAVATATGCTFSRNNQGILVNASTLDISRSTMSDNKTLGLQGAGKATINLGGNNQVTRNGTYGLHVGTSSTIPVGQVTVTVNGPGNTFNSNARHGVSVSAASRLKALHPVVANNNGFNGIMVDLNSRVELNGFTATGNARGAVYLATGGLIVKY